MKLLQLARNGDILNIAPILHQEFLKTGKKQELVVAKGYETLLEGMSYISPLVFSGSHMDIENALKQFNGSQNTQVMGDGKFIASQVYGKDYAISQSCDSFQKESWRLAGALPEWRHQHPLVFDNRSPEREQALLDKYTKHLKKPRWLVISDGGHSSPFPYRELLRELIDLKFSRTCDIIHLDQIKAERFYDLLAILDHPKTKAIVATDSGPLHLAYATQKPTVALIADRPSLWHGSSPRGHHLRYIRYSKFPESAVDMLEAIADIGKPGTFMPAGGLTRLIHAYASYPTNEETKRRNDFARETWHNEYQRSVGWFETPITDSHCTRNSKTLKDASGKLMFPDSRPLPFVTDILKLAALRAQEKDLIVFSNSDTCFSPGITSQIIEACEKHGGCHAHRRDFNALTKPLEASQVSKGMHYPGSDLFAFTKPFLRKCLPMFGDYVSGREGWDRALREIIKLQGGVELKDVIYHAVHPSEWSQPGVREQDPINRHNRRLLKSFLLANNLPLEEIAHLPA